tara:strand:- start:93 stop:236 length:144 start_codon:yes stop_codon:yes gene_type:complete
MVDQEEEPPMVTNMEQELGYLGKATEADMATPALLTMAMVLVVVQEP